MRRSSLPILAVAFLILAPGVAAVASPHGGKIAWVSDFMTGIESARREGRVAMVYSSAEWSDACRQLGAGPFSDAGVVDAAHEVVAVKIDCTDRSAHKVLRQRYGAGTLPTVVFVDSDGKKVAHARLLSDAVALRNQIRSVASGDSGSAVAVSGLLSGGGALGLLCGVLGLIVGFLRRGVGTGLAAFAVAAGGGVTFGAPGAGIGLTLGYLVATVGKPRPRGRQKIAGVIVLVTSAAMFGYAWLACTQASVLPTAVRPPVHALDTFDSAYARWEEQLTAGNAAQALEIADAFRRFSPQASDYEGDVDGMRSLALQRGAADVQSRSFGWTLDRVIERLGVYHGVAIGLALFLFGLGIVGLRSKPPSKFGYDQSHESPIGSGPGPRSMPPTTRFKR